MKLSEEHLGLRYQANSTILSIETTFADNNNSHSATHVSISNSHWVSSAQFRRYPFSHKRAVRCCFSRLELFQAREKRPRAEWQRRAIL